MQLAINSTNGRTHKIFRRGRGIRAWWLMAPGFGTLGETATGPVNSPGRIDRRRSRTGGFSLIEILCAILILGVGLVGLTQGVTTALTSSKESELQTVAAQLAAERLELLRADGYLSDGVKEGEFDESFSRYRWKQSITATEIDGLHEVEVAVMNAQSGQNIFELRTLLFEVPLTSSRDTEADRRDRARGKRERRERR